MEKEKKSKMPPIYGYLVCLVAVITFLFCIASLVNAIMDMSDPMHADSYRPAGSENLASYDLYKLDVMKSLSDKEGAYIPDEVTLKAMYEAAKDEKLNKVNHRSMNSIMVSGILIVISIVLFITHWMWMRRLRKRE